MWDDPKALNAFANSSSRLLAAFITSRLFW